MENKYILCEYTDHMTKEKRFVEINETRIIGHGLLTTVYFGKLRDSKNKEICEVAIKQICIERETPLKEVEIMRKIYHENIVNLYHCFVPAVFLKEFTKTKISLIMEYCEGRDLCKYLEKNPNLPESQIRDFFRQIVNGLNYLHNELRIIHRDIKPQNICLTNQKKTVKIVDYGISRFIKRDMTNMTMYQGTLGFMAPEVIKAELNSKGKYSFEADIFSLGATLFYMYFNREPWFNSPKPEEEKKNVHLASLVSIYEKAVNRGFDLFPSESQISLPAKTLILRMLSIKPEERITMAEILQDPYLRQDVSILKNPQTSDIMQRLNFEANKIMLAQDLLRKVNRYDRFCEKKEVWINALVFLTRFVEMSSVYLDSIVQEECYHRPWFPHERWALFLQDEAKIKIREKLRSMVTVSRRNLETLLKKLNNSSEILFYESGFSKDLKTAMINLIKEYKKTFDGGVEDDDDELVIWTLYQMMTFLELSYFRRKEGGNFHFESFQKDLKEKVENEKWIILQRLELFYKKMNI